MELKILDKVTLLLAALAIISLVGVSNSQAKAWVPLLIQSSSQSQASR